MRKSIQDVYTEMYTEAVEEDTPYDIKDYTTMVYNLDEASGHGDTIDEAHSGHGDSAKVKNMLLAAYKRGIIDYKPTKNGWFLKSKKGLDTLTIDRGESALHPLRRFLHKL